MLKIKDCLLREIYKSNLTKNQIKILIYIILRSDENGLIKIHHDMKKELNISNGSFYNSLLELERYNFISRKKCGSEIEIKINGNDFSQPGAYTKLNTSFFTSEEYLKLSAGEIKTYLFTYFQIAKKKGLEDSNDKNRYKAIKKDTYGSISKNINISIRMVKHHLNKLIKKGFLHFVSKCIYNKPKNAKLDVLTMASKYLQGDIRKVSEKGKYEDIRVGNDTLYNEHIIKNMCRKYKISTSEQDIVDASMLVRQYKNKALELDTDIIYVLKKSVEHFKVTYDKLNSKLLHRIIRNELDSISNSILVKN